MNLLVTLLSFLWTLMDNWAIPAIALVGAWLCYKAAVKAHNSGSSRQVGTGTANVRVERSDEKVPYLRLWHTWVCILCIVVFVIYMIWQHS